MFQGSPGGSPSTPAADGASSTAPRDTRRKPYTPPIGYELDVKLIRWSTIGGRYAFVNPDRISMIRTAEKYVAYLLDDGTQVYGDLGIGHMLAAFPGKWLRVHRNCAVRKDDIVRIERGLVTLASGETCTISRRQFVGLFERSVSINREVSESDRARRASWLQPGLS